jgi:hypothetical protein
VITTLTPEEDDMKTTTPIGLPLDELRVEELEPRLEFVTYECRPIGGECVVYELGESDGDFQPVLGYYECPGPVG